MASAYFFMISGANLLGYRERYTTSVFFKKRAAKIITPLIFWSIITYLYKVFTSPLDFSVTNFLKMFIYNEIQPNYWFFYVIIAIYLCVPFMSVITVDKHKNLVAYIIILSILTTALGPILFQLMGRPYPSFFNLPMLGSYIGFYFLGWYIHNYDFQKKYRVIIYIFGIISMLIMFFGTIYLSVNAGAMDRTLYYYNSIFVYSSSATVYIFVKSIYTRSETIKERKLIKTISAISLGIYASHDLVINVIKNFFQLDITNIFYMVLFPVVVITVLIPIILIAKKIPVIKNVV